MSGFLDASKNIVYIQFVRTAIKGRNIKKETSTKRNKGTPPKKNKKIVSV